MTDTAWPALSFAQVRGALTAPGAPFEIQEVEVRGRTVKVFRDAPPTLLHTFIFSRQHGEKIFLVHGDERVSFEAFSRAVLALAARLKADGIQKGDRVAIAMRNVPEWPVAFFAATLIGGIAVPLNAWWTGEELAYALKDSGSRALIADADRLARLTDLNALPDLTNLYVSRASALTDAVKLEDVIGAPNDWASLPEGELPNVPLDPEDDATIFYTSGTSGRPKGALGTHRSNGTNLHAIAWSQISATLRRGETPVDPITGPQKVSLMSIPFFHTTGCQAVMVASLASGTKIVLMRRFDAEEALTLIETEKVTSAGGVPTIAWQLLQHPTFAQHDTSSLENMAYGGAPAAPELIQRLRTGAPKALPGTGWGMTETSATVTHHTGEDYVRRPDSCGQVIPICELKIIDADGNTLPIGEVGELCAYGPNIVKGYWNKPEETARTFVDGWVRTGDIARLDEEGFCYIIDRAKDLIIRGGENIASVEVENALFEHPGVADCAVVGLPHTVLGEIPAALIVPVEGAAIDEAALRAHCADRLAGFKVPVQFAFQSEPLPRNAAGKVLKPLVRATLLKA